MQRVTPTGLRFHPTLLLIGAALLCGCATVDNDRLVVADMDLPAVAPEASENSEPLHPATGPSLSGVDRSNWSEHEIVVWQDGVRHHPRFTSNQPRYTDATARQRGEYPTAVSALELGGDAGAQFWEGFAGPVWGGMDVLLFLPRAIARGGPGSIVASPDDTYARAPGAPAPALDAVVAPIESVPER